MSTTDDFVQTFLNEEKNRTSQALKRLIDHSENHAIIIKLLNYPLNELQNASIEGKSVFAYCLEKNPMLTTSHYSFMLSAFSGTLTEKNLLPLHYALNLILQEKLLKHDHSLDPVKICLLLGADINAQDSKGNTALHFYIKRIAVMQQDFDRRFNQNSKKNLDLISEYRPTLHPKILKFLLDNGANLTLTDRHNKTPLDYAAPRIVKYIELYCHKKNTIIFFDKSIVWQPDSPPASRINNDLALLNFPAHPSISRTPAMPLKPKMLDKNAAEKWIEQWQDEKKLEAEQLINSVRYVSFPEFLLGLEKTIASFNHYLNKLPKEERNYILAIDGRTQNSSPWVSALALRYLEFMPDKILNLDEMRKLDQEQNYDHILFIDDASYSGNQLTHRAQYFSNLAVFANAFFAFQLHIAIPFMTETTVKRLQPFGFIIHQHEKIEEIKSNLTHGLTLTYFQHKLADTGISTADFFATLLPKIKPPYKENPLIQEQASKIQLKTLKEQNVDEYILQCWDKAEKEEQFPPYERIYTFTDALHEAKKYLSQKNFAPDNTSFFKTSIALTEPETEQYPQPGKIFN